MASSGPSSIAPIRWTSWTGIPIISRDGQTWVSRFVVSQADLYVVSQKGR